MIALLLALAACTGSPDTDTDTSAGTDVDTDTDSDTVASDETNRDGECTFNRECPADQRCECTDGACVCADGPRGTGVNGVDTCEDGNDCASSLCVEGTGGVFYCSDECEDEDDCGPNLPVCADIAFLGRICIRESG